MIRDVFQLLCSVSWCFAVSVSVWDPAGGIQASEFLKICFLKRELHTSLQITFGLYELSQQIMHYKQLNPVSNLCRRELLFGFHLTWVCILTLLRGSSGEKKVLKTKAFD